MRCLLRGQVHERILSLKNQIIQFFEDQNASCKFSKQTFYRNAAFLSNIRSKRNQLNVSLQGETKTVIRDVAAMAWWLERLLRSR